MVSHCYKKNNVGKGLPVGVISKISGHTRK